MRIIYYSAANSLLIMHAIMFYHIYWEIKKLSFLNTIYDNYRDSEYFFYDNII